jgi:hypothetical protein
MQSVLVKVAEQTSPAAVVQGFKPLSGGFVSQASDLFKAFTDDDLESSKLSVLRNMSVLTVAEFKEEIALAQKLADETDAGNGFKAADKPQSMEERYGIKRRVLNQRLSEAKRLFGVFKQAPEVLKEKGYAASLIAARQWLSDNSKTWEGDTALTKEAKEAKSERKALAKAIGTAVANGASIESAVNDAKYKVQEDKLAAFINNLVKNNDGDMLFTACLRIIESADVDSIQSAIEYLSEAKMLIQSDNIPDAE